MVVAIIAVLVAILLPALGQAREHAKQVLCSSNLHQIGVGSQYYANEWNDCFPSVDSGSYGRPDLAHRDHDIARWGVGGTRDCYGWANAYPTDKRPLNRYLKDFGDAKELWWCPSDHWPALAQIDPNQAAAGFENTCFDRYGTSYPFNAHGNGSFGRRGLFGNKRASIERPVKTIEFHENVAFNYYNNRTYDYGLRQHDEQEPMAVILFVDGHVGYVLMRPYPDAQNCEDYIWMP